LKNVNEFLTYSRLTVSYVPSVIMLIELKKSVSV